MARESLVAAVLASSAAFAGDAAPAELWASPVTGAGGGALATIAPWVVQTVLVWALAEASRALAARRRRRARLVLEEREPVTRPGGTGDESQVKAAEPEA